MYKRQGHINIAAAGGPTWERCCQALGKSEMLTDPKFVTGQARSDNRAELREIIEAVTATNTKAHWIDTMTKAGVPCGPINSIDETFAEPQVKHLGIATPVQHPTLGAFDIVGQPINMTAAAQPDELRPAPDPGQHSDDVLQSLGYDADAIAALRERGVV